MSCLVSPSWMLICPDQLVLAWDSSWFSLNQLHAFFWGDHVLLVDQLHVQKQCFTACNPDGDGRYDQRDFVHHTHRALLYVIYESKESHFNGRRVPHANLWSTPIGSVQTRESWSMSSCVWPTTRKQIFIWWWIKKEAVSPLITISPIFVLFSTKKSHS